MNIVKLVKNEIFDTTTLEIKLGRETVGTKKKILCVVDANKYIDMKKQSIFMVSIDSEIYKVYIGVKKVVGNEVIVGLMEV